MPPPQDENPYDQSGFDSEGNEIAKSGIRYRQVDSEGEEALPVSDEEKEQPPEDFCYYCCCFCYCYYCCYYRYSTATTRYAES